MTWRMGRVSSSRHAATAPPNKVPNCNDKRVTVLKSALLFLSSFGDDEEGASQVASFGLESSLSFFMVAKYGPTSDVVAKVVARKVLKAK